MKRKNIHFEKGPIGWLQRYALFAYDFPVGLFIGVLITVLFFGVIGGLLGFKLSESDSEWDIKTNKHVKQNAAIDEALDQISEETTQAPYSVEANELQIWVTYEAIKGENRNIFTAENLKTQKEVENEIMSGKFNRVCLRNYANDATGVDDTDCVLPLSVLLLFFEYDAETTQFGDWLPNADGETPSDSEAIAAGIQRLNADLFLGAFFVDKQYSPDNPRSRFTRSRFDLGVPIVFSEFDEGRRKLERGEVIPFYENSKTDEDDQFDAIYDEFLEDLEDRLFGLLHMEKPGPLKTHYNDFGEIDNLEVLFWNPELQEKEFTRVVQMDFMWAGLSILSVWVYMLIHLGSVFLSLIGIFEIFMAFPVALFFYKPLFQIEFFSELNLLVIFILLGIGADDIFVYTDAYKQSANVPGVDPSLQGRLMYASSRASKAVFVTSFTTMAAFFATAVSPLMPMQAFGIFAALCIIFLFLINLVLMPPALVMYAGYTPYLARWLCPCCVPERRPEWVNTYCPCCTCCHVEIDETFFLPLGTPESNSPQHETPQTEHQSRPETEMTPTAGASTAHTDHNATGQLQKGPIEFKRQNSLADAEVHDLRSIEKFFYGPFFLFLQQAKWIILLCGLALFVAGLVLISTFKTPDEAEQWFPDDHVYNKFLDYLDPQKTPFRDSTEDNVAEVHLVWGLKGMNPNKRNIWDGDDFGELEYDNTFDPRPPANQEFLLSVCDRVREAPCGASACAEPYLIRIDRTVTGQQDSPQQKCWIEDFKDWVNGTTSFTFPVPSRQFVPLVAQYLEDPVNNVEFGEDIGYSRVNNELRFILFKFDSTFRPPASSSKVKDVIDEWENFVNELNADARRQNLTGVDKAFESGREAWLWPSTADALVQGAVSGLILVFVLAFVVLNLASGNLIISIIAVMTIAGIVSTVMGVGIRGIMDWDLGTAESITIVILIGFSMDYTLHLSDAYMESPHSNREDRTRDAMTHLGISVTAGALTTLISGLFLWATVLIFFQKFAFNVTATVFTSFLFSIFVFPSLCLVMGPQGDFGNWRTMLCACRSRMGSS